MKKIPTLFMREFKDHKVTRIWDQLTSPDLEWVLRGEGDATEKIDGSCCAIINGQFYKRYDAKRGKKPPENAIPCDDPDPITGHWPHWVPVDPEDPANKWHIVARDNAVKHGLELVDGTYEVFGPHFQGNPYGLIQDYMEPHGKNVLNVERYFFCFFFISCSPGVPW